ncbi:MAG: uroporphyrinogen-III synthase [Phenylobacterium sp.]|uniref:uroporphyrinogen-III synthase n=1 Tax=Phenylobacterium sp. TaxID=1871053 RepID=UPI001B7A9758|nr:uroporphyrinogen-III synthase [Phenylobacterium sp.]MBP7816386.1 uroporphyrinogen-III synthase [Phenylobacterium sp.]MBP9233018.1 uroporphyrinogen-III synthase [Phenylobacterium sp.]MBP9753983.1 uroporphyrinogen-III synthase [Phenylobacterium sp.]
MSARKIWITRAQPAAEATAARVRALGHEPFVAPLLKVEPVDGVEVDLRGVCALAFTSANGVRAFIEATPERSLRVFAVGAATAQAVRAAGFKNVLSADGDVEALAEGIAARKRDLKGCVLHPGAAEPAGDLVGALETHGIEARRLILYDTCPAPLTAEEQAVLPEIDAVLLHSPKAAQALADLLKDSPQPRMRALCLSKAVMKPLARTKLAAKVFAPFPLEAALLNLIDR